MRRTALACSLFLVLAAAAVPAAAQGPGTSGRSGYIYGVMDGRFAFAGPWAGPWTTTGDVQGALRSLGLAKMYTRHTTSPEGTLSEGEFRIVAASGDEISGSYTAAGAWISDSQVLGAAELVVVSGTGRFAHASGRLAAAFLETFDDPTYASAGVTWTVKGMIED